MTPSLQVMSLQKGKNNMANRKRNIQMLFCVTPEEKQLIRRKMLLSNTRNMGAYLRKMAIDGYIINTDTTPLRQQYEEMHKIKRFPYSGSFCVI